MTLAEIDRIRDKTLKDLPSCTSELIPRGHGDANGTNFDGYVLRVNYAGQSQIIESEEQLDQWLSRFGVKT